MSEKVPPQLDELVVLCERLLQLARLYQRHPPKDPRRRGFVQRATDYAELAMKDLHAGLRGASDAVTKDRKLANSITKLRNGSSGAKGGTPEARTFQGTTANVSIRDLLLMLGMQRKTGQLRVKLANEITSFSFHAGRMIGAGCSRTPSEGRLSELLVAQGALKRDELDKFVAGRNPNARGLGRALVFKGLVTSEQLRAAIERRVRILVEATLAADEASFSFREGLVEEFDADVRLEVAPLLEPEPEPEKDPELEGDDSATGNEDRVLDQLRAQLLAMQSGELKSKPQQRKSHG